MLYATRIHCVLQTCSVLFGESGSDTLYGNAGVDKIYPGEGDVVYGGHKSDK